MSLFSRQWIGFWAEKQARRFLQRCGLSLIDKNYHCPFGEIDLIMRDQMALVFVEVRYRRSLSHGGALASVDGHKQQRLVRTAQHYCQRYLPPWTDEMRFDVVALQHGKSPQWVQAAFTL